MDGILTCKNKIKERLSSLEQTEDMVISGTVSSISGFMIEAVGLAVSVGSICSIYIASSQKSLLAEVIGFSNDITMLMAYEEIQGILPGNKITYCYKMFQVPVDASLLGRILNGLCEPIDGGEPLAVSTYYQRQAAAMNPIHRMRISKPVDVGVRAINALITVGQGQRLGIFAGSGVGKSILLGMITKFTKADVVIVGLIGERGREVKEFIEEIIGFANLQKTIIIAAPVDTSPLMRVNGAMVATTIAEYFRDQGLSVLLIIDSLTRFAQALRQIYLTMGEMPSTRGFSPSVFSRISQLVERSGNGREDQGSITSFYTVLNEGDDINDPISDHVRSILDGHINLSRKLADSGHYPAIDISSSISRVMNSIIKPEHSDCALKFKRLISGWQQNQDLIKMGMYHVGTDPSVDEAIKYHEKMIGFLRQGIHDNTDMESSINEMLELFN